MTSLQELDRQICVCTRCELSASRTNAVPGEGPVTARLMIVGEAPGEQEDLQGRPFVGAAGRLLMELLGSAGIDRASVYITNIVKCRPPNNRPPRTIEVKACSEFLQRQIALIKPRVICVMGNPAIHALIDKKVSVSEIHGTPCRKEGITYFPSYHPAAALYDAKLKEVIAEDIKKLKQLLDEAADEAPHKKENRLDSWI